MSNRVKKLLLFTVSACPMGRSMNHVLSEVQETISDVDFQKVWIDKEVDKTNRYRIKENPTTLLLGLAGEELYRIEGFMETSEVLEKIDMVNTSNYDSTQPIAENSEAEETYVVYLFQLKTIVPVEVKVLNKTSVRTPRITAIQTLINASIPQLENPFPPGTKLELVKFTKNAGDVYLQIPMKAAVNIDRMKVLLEKTLSHFGIQSITLHAQSYEGKDGGER